MTGGPASGGVLPARILEGTVVEVDTKNYRVAVAYSHAPGTVSDVRIVSLYCHPHSGEGVNVLPEPGASCYVGFPSEPNGRPFLFGYVMPPTSREGDRGARPEQSGGDIVHTTRDGNTIALRRGGLVQVMSSPLCQALYVPVGNMIRHIFAQKEEASLLGKMEWVHDDTGAAGTDAHYRAEFKDQVESITPRVVVEISSSRVDLMPLGYINQEGDVPDPFLPQQSNLRMKLMDATGQIPQFELQISEGGDLHINCAGYTLLRSAGLFRVYAPAGHDVVGVGWSIRVSSTGTRDEKLLASTTQCATALTMRAPAIALEGAVSLGSMSASNSVSRAEVNEAWVANRLIPALAAAGISVAPLTGSASPVRTA